MIVNICDLCEQPIKNYGNLISAAHNMHPTLDDVELYNTCDECYRLIKLIFRAKRKGALKILEDLEKTYKLEQKEKKGKKC